MEDTTTNAAVVAELAIAVGEPRTAIDEGGERSIPYAIIPTGYRLQDVESLFPVPARKRGSITYRDAASFIAAVKLDGDAGGTRLYCNPIKPSFKAVFNDHGSDPGWRDHIALYSCPLSVEWTTWLGLNKKQMGQEAFAQFIEDNAPDCVSPTSADMIEIARTLEAKKKVNFASGIRLSNGQSELTYEEEISGTAAKGRLSIPETFTIGIAVLEGGPKYAVHARLRYRIADKGVLTMWYDLDRPHKVLEDAGAEVLKHITDATGYEVLNGD